MTVLQQYSYTVYDYTASIPKFLFRQVAAGNLLSKKVLDVLLTVLKISSSMKCGVRYQQKSSLHDLPQLCCQRNVEVDQRTDSSALSDQHLFLLTPISVVVIFNTLPLDRQYITLIYSFHR